jgi:hypothetical protein
VVQLSTGQRRQVLWRASRGWHTRQGSDCQRRDYIAIFSPTAAYTLEGRSHKATGAPPRMEIFFSLRSAKNPIHSPSGEKNGSKPFSVPAAAQVGPVRVGAWPAVAYHPAPRGIYEPPPIGRDGDCRTDAGHRLRTEIDA